MATQKLRGAVGREDILETAFAFYAEAGEAGFSVRKVAGKVGVDPMTVLHHFGSKNGLMRQIADRALQSVVVPPATSDWAQDLRSVAHAYRELAHRHPRIFHLHFRYHATGPVDHESSEVVYQAMRRAGLDDDDVAELGLAFYAFVLGFLLAETEGLVAPIGDSDERELTGLDSSRFPVTRALIPAFKALNPDRAYQRSIDTLIAGIAIQKQKTANADVISRIDPAESHHADRIKRQSTG